MKCLAAVTRATRMQFVVVEEATTLRTGFCSSADHLFSMSAVVYVIMKKMTEKLSSYRDDWMRNMIK